MNQEQRHVYLCSREWAVRRERIRRRARGRCERCRRARMNAVHHLTYARLGHERDSDLQAICDPCHEFVSGKSDYDPRGGVPWRWVWLSVKRAVAAGIAAYLAWELL
jgi:5-methylcytosine-specific restriction endonuclease McrA